MQRVLISACLFAACGPANGPQPRFSDEPLVVYAADSYASRQLLPLCAIGAKSDFVAKVEVLSLGELFHYSRAWPALPMTPVRMRTLMVLKGAAAFATSGEEVTFHGAPDAGVVEAGPLFGEGGVGVTAWVAAGFWAPSKLHASVGNWFVMDPKPPDAGSALVGGVAAGGSEEWPGLRTLARISEAEFAREIMTPCPAPSPPLPRDPNDAGLSSQP